LCFWCSVFGNRFLIQSMYSVRVCQYYINTTSIPHQTTPNHTKPHHQTTFPVCLGIEQCGCDIEHHVRDVHDLGHVHLLVRHLHLVVLHFGTSRGMGDVVVRLHLSRILGLYANATRWRVAPSTQRTQVSGYDAVVMHCDTTAAIYYN
jgi:hypothetical protein